jgi:hypothetical protein
MTAGNAGFLSAPGGRIGSGGRGRPACPQSRVGGLPGEPLGPRHAKVSPRGGKQPRVQVRDEEARPGSPVKDELVRGRHLVRVGQVKAPPVGRERPAHIYRQLKDAVRRATEITEIHDDARPLPIPGGSLMNGRVRHVA